MVLHPDLFERVYSLVRDGQLASARTLIEAQLALASDDFERSVWWSALAQAHQSGGDDELAREAFLRAESFAPNDAALAVMVGTFLLAAFGDTEASGQRAVRVLAQGQLDAAGVHQAHQLLCRVACFRGDSPGAAEHLLKSMDVQYDQSMLAGPELDAVREMLHAGIGADACRAYLDAVGAWVAEHGAPEFFPGEIARLHRLLRSPKRDEGG